MRRYFPHYFNVKENMNYVGPFPDAAFFDPTMMKPEDRNKFYKWHIEKVRSIIEILIFCVEFS
jgi:hypothetical protein